MKDFNDAVSKVAKTFGYTKKRVLADGIVVEIEAENGEDFQNYSYENGDIVEAGTPIGVEVFDPETDNPEDDAVFYMYDHILIG